MELSRDLKDFLRLLTEHEVQFMIVGAHAVAFHAFPRNTGDIDFWVRKSGENAQRILDALEEFGFGSLGLTIDDLIDPNKVIQFGREPNRIDILTFLTGLEFDDCMVRAVSAMYEGIPVKVISLDDLVANKKATGRDKDILDVKEFERLGLVRNNVKD